MDPNSHQNEIEREVTLLILDDDPAAIAGSIAGLREISGFTLLPRKTEVLCDTYFDTADQSLQRKRIALRIRNINGERYVTLKGPGQSTSLGEVRLEIEEQWSRRALSRVIRELEKWGVTIAHADVGFDESNPRDMLAELGFQVVQDRETYRTVREVVADQIRATVEAAELAIDSVVYHFGELDIRHYELEVEAKSEQAALMIKAVTDILTDMYKGTLRLWKHSKLATGKAIKELVEEGTIEEFLDADKNLKPIAYEKINKVLEEERKRSS